jgi:hypothetical protein
VRSAADPEDARVRLRAVLRRMIEGIWCLFVPNGRWRFAAVRAQFTGGAHRDFLILHRFGHRNPTSHRAPQTWVHSFAEMDVKGRLDLRDQAHVRKLEAALSAVVMSADESSSPARRRKRK